MTARIKLHTSIDRDSPSYINVSSALGDEVKRVSDVKYVKYPRILRLVSPVVHTKAPPNLVPTYPQPDRCSWLLTLVIELRVYRSSIILSFLWIKDQHNLSSIFTPQKVPYKPLLRAGIVEYTRAKKRGIFSPKNNLGRLSIILLCARLAFITLQHIIYTYGLCIYNCSTTWLALRWNLRRLSWLLPYAIYFPSFLCYRSHCFQPVPFGIHTYDFLTASHAVLLY